MLQSLIASRFLRSLDGLHAGSLQLTTPEGQTYHFEGREPGHAAELRLRDWGAVRRMMLRGSVGVTEVYRDGRLETDDLTRLLLFALQNSHRLDDVVNGNPFAQAMSQLRYLLFDRNTLRGSKRNIHAHYDLGNDFYSLWLDPGMTYSSALWRRPDESLDQAQLNKYDRILDRLEVDSGRLLEVGCGWGGFAERALQRGDFGYRGITLSDEQHRWANDRLAGFGTDPRVVLEDYRAQQGKFDHIVSIEMFEAVGERYWRTYFDKLRELLADGGRAVVQTITIDDKLFRAYRRSADMIRSFIFPGGMLPSPSVFEATAARSGLKVVDRFDFGLDYARTLREWLDRFETAVPKLADLGFDDRFVRVWRFYLAGCIATFETGRTSGQQVELRHV